MPKIEIKNFGPFKDACLEWQSDQIVMVVAANGLGKTVLSVALQKLLCGTEYISEDVQMDRLIHDGEKGYSLIWQDKDFEIVEFRDNGSPRCQFWQNGRLFQGRDTGSKDNRVSEHRQAIDALFGLSGLSRKQIAEIFLRRMLISPETTALFNMGDTELTRTLLAMFDVEEVQERRQKIMEEKNKLKKELDGVQRFKAPDLRVEDEKALQQEIEALTAQIAGINSPSMLPKMESELLRLQQRSKSMFAEREAMLKEYEAILEQNKDFQSVNVQELAAKLGRLRHPLILSDLKGNNIREKSRFIQLFENTHGHIRKRIAELEAFVNSITKFPDSDKRDLWTFKIHQIDAELAKIKDGKEPLVCPVCKDKQILKCGWCGSNFQIEFGHLVKFDPVKDDRSRLESERGELIFNITMIEAKLELDRKHEEWKRLEAGKAEKLAKFDSEYQALEQELIESEKLANDWYKLDQARLYHETKQKHTELTLEVNTEKADLNRQIERLQAEIEKTKEAAPLFESLASLNERLITSKANRAALAAYAKQKQEIDALESKILDHERIVKDLPIFMRQEIDRKSGHLVYRANEILSEIGGEGDIRFNAGDDEEIRKIVIEQQKDGFWREVRSGGSSYSERRLIAIALLLAQQQLYKEYFRPVDLIIHDDTFAGLSLVRQELLAQGIRNVAKGTQLILTSYDHTIDLVGPDKLYQLKKQGRETIVLGE